MASTQPPHPRAALAFMGWLARKHGETPDSFPRRAALSSLHQHRSAGAEEVGLQEPDHRYARRTTTMRSGRRDDEHSPRAKLSAKHSAPFAGAQHDSSRG